MGYLGHILPRYTTPFDHSNGVVIRTNGGTLTINAVTDTLNHYGTAEKIDIVAIANASYHENGTVQLIAVKQGHVKLEGDADVNGIYVYNDSTSTEKDDSFEEIKITVGSGVEVPKLSRSAVEIADEGTKVCTIVTDQAKDVYLFNEGIYEQIKTVDEGKPISDASATWADDETKNTDNTQTAAQQLANEWTGRDEDGNIANQTVTVAGTDYTVVFNDETRKFETYTGYVDENNKGTQIVVDTTAGEAEQAAAQAILDAATTKVEQTAKESGKTVEEAQNLSALKGSGTESDPWLITCRADMDHIKDLSDKYYYYKVKSSDVNIDFTQWNAVNLYGSFDGNGATFNIPYMLFKNWDVDSRGGYIKNLTINANIESSGAVGIVARQPESVSSELGTQTFSNITIHGKVTGAGVGLFGAYLGNNTGYCGDIIIENCNSDAVLISTSSGSGVGAFVLHTLYCNNVYLKNSRFNGIIYHSGRYGYWCDMSSSSTWYVDANSMPNNGDYLIDEDAKGKSSNLNYITKTQETVNGVSYNRFVLNAIPGTGDTKVTTWYTYVKYQLSVYELNKTTKTTSASIGEAITLDKTNGATRCEASLFISPNDKDGYGGYLACYASEEAISTNGNKWSSSTITNSNITINSNLTSVTGYNSDHTTFNVISSSYGSSYGTAYVSFVEYAGEQILKITTITIGNGTVQVLFSYDGGTTFVSTNIALAKSTNQSFSIPQGYSVSTVYQVKYINYEYTDVLLTENSEYLINGNELSIVAAPGYPVKVVLSSNN